MYSLLISCPIYTHFSDPSSPLLLSCPVCRNSNLCSLYWYTSVNVVSSIPFTNLSLPTPPLFGVVRYTPWLCHFWDWGLTLVDSYIREILNSFRVFCVWQCVIYAWRHTSTFFVSWYIYCNTCVCVHTRTSTTLSNLCVSISAWIQMQFLCLRILSSKRAAVTIWFHAFDRNLVRVQRCPLFVVRHKP